VPRPLLRRCWTPIPAMVAEAASRGIPSPG